MKNEKYTVTLADKKKAEELLNCDFDDDDDDKLFSKPLQIETRKLKFLRDYDCNVLFIERLHYLKEALRTSSKVLTTQESIDRLFIHCFDENPRVSMQAKVNFVGLLAVQDYPWLIKLATLYEAISTFGVSPILLPVGTQQAVPRYCCVQRDHNESVLYGSLEFQLYTSNDAIFSSVPAARQYFATFLEALISTFKQIEKK
jgi:hypothetical protein